MKPWNRRNGYACVLVSSQAGVVPRVKLQKSLYLRESRSMEKSGSGSSGLEGKLEVRKESSECRQASRSRAVKERQTDTGVARKEDRRKWGSRWGQQSQESRGKLNWKYRLDTGPCPLLERKRVMKTMMGRGAHSKTTWQPLLPWEMAGRPWIRTGSCEHQMNGQWQEKDQGSPCIPVC